MDTSVTFCKKRLALDKPHFVWYIIPMRDNKNNLPVIKHIQDFDAEFNKIFRDEIFMPMVKFAVTLVFIAIVLDYGFQMIEAIDTLTN